MKKLIPLLLLIAIMILTLSFSYAGRFSTMGGLGVSTVGGVSPDYTNLYDAATDFNAFPGGSAGNWTIYINGNLSEANSITLGNPVNGFSILIKPLTQCTITFTRVADNPGVSGDFIIGAVNTTSMEILAKVDNVTIDGSVTTGTQDLTIQNTAVSIANANIIRVFGDCDNVQIKNCIFKNLSTSGSSNYGINFTSRLTTGGTIGLHPDNSVVENCNIMSVGGLASQGIGYGNSGTCPAGIAQNNIQIKNNTLLARTRTIYMAYVANATVSNNTVRLNQTSTGLYSSIIGHWGANSAPFTMFIFNNVIDQASTANATAGGFGLIGLEIDMTGNYYVYNNEFTNFVDTGSSASGSHLLGAIRGNGSSANYYIYNNSIFMQNNALFTGMSNDSCYAIGLTGGSTNGAVIVKNNLIRMEQKGGVCIRKGGGSTSGLVQNIDYNVLSADTANGAFVGSLVGGIGMTRATTLSDWQSIQKSWDRNSQELNPFTSSPATWTSTSDLHFNNASVTGLIAGQMIRLPGYDKDIDGNARNTINPTIGCDELNMYTTATSAVAFNTKVTDSYGISSLQGKLVHIYGAVYSPTSLDTTVGGLMQRFIVDTASELGILVEGTGFYTSPTSHSAFARGDLMDALGFINTSFGQTKLMLLDKGTNLGTSGYTFTPLNAGNIAAFDTFDATAASGGELFESRPVTLSNVTVLRTIALGTTNFNSILIELGDASANWNGGYYANESITFRWFIPKGSNILKSLQDRVLVRGQVINSLTGVGYQNSTSGKAAYYIMSVDSSDINFAAELGAIYDSQLKWIWSTPTVYNIYKAVNGTDIYRGQSIVTSIYWPDLSPRGSDQIRNFGYSPLNNHIYINSRDTTAPAIIDATNGAFIGTLDTTGIGGGTFALGRLGADAQGNIYGTNLQTGANNLKIYKWANEAAIPTVLVSTAVPAAFRTGDGFNVQDMTDGSVKILVTGGNNSTILIYNADGSQFALVSTNINASSAMADIDPDTYDIWYKRYSLPTYVIPSSVWWPATTNGASTIINVYSCASIGKDLIPYSTFSLKIAKRNGKKYLVTTDCVGNWTDDLNGGIGSIQSAHALIFDITNGIPSATSLATTGTRYFGRSGNSAPITQPATINATSFASLDKFNNIIHLTENLGLTSWTGFVLPIDLWEDYGK